MTHSLPLLALLAPLLVATSAADAAPRTRDGLQARIAVGPSFAVGTLETAAGDSDSDGIGVSTQLSVGYTVRPGLVLGLATFPLVTPAPSYSGIDAGGQHISATGPFVDFYPWRDRGLHLQGGVLVTAGYLDGGARDGQIGAGVGASLGFGYDHFVSDEWSIGAIARVTAYRLFGVDDQIQLVAPAVLVALTWH